MSRSRILAGFTLALLLATTATSAAVTMFPITSGVSQDTTVYKPGNGVTLPSVVHEVKPAYTAEAMQHKIQGSVWMTVVVLADGGIGDVLVTRSLDAEHGLDQQAIKAAKQWRFRPGTKDGKPVAVEVVLEMTFTLKEKPKEGPSF